ncbi:hypothetical protein [Parvibacter caecicola]|uniref:hypothetical protein n=1 Tax=Parvibacter caecicola TaxID=747645 RepID=UPI002731EEAB|nr:hypothetical protein [Parvibacter caecicola]
MVDLIWADAYGREMGFIGKAEGDFTIGTPNTFSLTVPKGMGIGAGCYVMIDGTEYGGMVDGMEFDTAGHGITLTGPTWHGLLGYQAIVPDDGQAYYTATGDCNAVMGRILSRVGLTDRMTADSGASGFSVSGYQFPRLSTQMDAYTGICAMLASVGAKLRICYDSKLRKAVLSAVERADYTDDGIDGDRTAFHIRTGRTVNHLHCLGTGEGAARTRLDLYADAKGRISKTQSVFGMAHRCEVYENSSSEAADLEAEGVKRLTKLQAGMAECGLSGADNGRYDIGDIVGGTSTEHGVSVVTTVAQKTAYVTSKGITYETKTALEVQA